MSSTNNSPKVVASFFVEALEKWGAPQLLRTDCGTENNVCAAIQSTIHQTSNSHLYGSSVTNQRIEALWCKLKPAVAGWKQHFKQLHENHLYTPQDDNQLSAFRFSFMDLIQETLNGFMLYWNTHHVRQSSAIAGGVPDLLFYANEQYKTEVSAGKLQEARSHCESPTVTGSSDLDDYMKYVFTVKNLSKPKNKTEAFTLFTSLHDSLKQ